MFESYSPNMLKTYNQCPKKFHFRYIKKISMPINDEIFETGKNIHALASYCLKKEDISKLEKALSVKDTEIWTCLKNCKYFGYEYINSEYNLSVKLDNKFFGGRLDALVKNNDKYYILDYKTGSAPKNAIYDFQTMIYMLAVSEFFQTNNITFIYIDLKNKTEVEIEFSEDLKNEYQEKLTQISKKIEKTEFTAIKNTDCDCEYNVICYH